MDYAENQFGRPEIPSTQLRCHQLPQSGSEYYPDIIEFALTFDGYARYPERLASIGQQAKSDFEKSGKLSQSLDRLQASLFFQQRFWRANERDPDAEAMRFINALLKAIRARVLAQEEQVVSKKSKPNRIDKTF